MSENTTQAQHLTELDFDVSKIPNQLEQIGKMTQSYAEEISNNFQRTTADLMDFTKVANQLSGSAPAFKRASEEVKQAIEGSFSDLTGNQSIISNIFSKEDIDEAKERLLSLLSVYGRISKVKIDTDGDSNTLKAAVTSIDDYGRSITKVFKLQKKEIENAESDAKEYSSVWEKVSSSITENKEQQRKNAEMQEKQIKKNIAFLDAQIERQKDLTNKYSLNIGENSDIAYQSKVLQGQLEIIRNHVQLTKEFSEVEEKRISLISQKNKELERRYQVEIKSERELAKEIETHQKQKDDFYKRNISQIDLEIEKRKEESRAFSQALREQMENEAQREKSLKKNIDFIDNLIEKQKDLNAKYTSKHGEYSEFAKETRELQKQLEIIKEQVEKNKEFTESEKKQTEEIIKQSRELERQSKTFTPDKPNTFLKSLDAVKFLAVQKGAYLAEEAIQKTFETLKSVEDQVVEITRVFSDANVDMGNFSKSMFNLATTYGRSFEDAGEVVLRFAQAGENAEDSLKLAETALLALNTAELDVESSTNSLIGIMQQWKMENEDFPLLIDKINYTADNFAVTSQDLVDGLLRSSSAAKNAKMSFDETIGVLTAMREASGRTGKEVGNALNTLITYTQKAQMDGTLEGIGFNVYTDKNKQALKSVLDMWKEMSEVVTSGNEDIVDALMEQSDATSLLSDEVANYAGLTDELAKIRETENQLNKEAITDMEKQEIYETGKTLRRNYFIALLNNMNKAQEVTNELTKAEGHSMNENAKYMDTLTAKYNIFIGSLRELAQQAGESGLTDLAKDALDLATGFNQMLMSVGGAETALGIILSIILQIKSAKISEWTDDLVSSISNVAKASKNLIPAMQTAYKSGGAFKAVMTGLWNINPLRWYTTLTLAYTGITAAIKKSNEEAEKNRQEIIENAKAEQQRVKSLSELEAKYNALAGVESRTAEQDQAMLETSEKLKSSLGDRAKALEGLTVGTSEYNQKLREQIELEENSLKNSLISATKAAKESLEASIKSDSFGGIAGALGFKDIGISLPTQELYEADGALSSIGNSLSEIMGGFSDMQSRWGDGGIGKFFAPDDNTADEILEYYDALMLSKQALNAMTEGMSESEREAFLASETYRAISEELSKLEQEGKVAAVVQAEVNKAFLDLKGSIPDSASGFDEFVDKVMESTGLGESFKGVVEEMAKQTIPVFKSAVDEASGSVSELTEAQNRAAGAAKLLQDASKAVDDLQSAYSTLIGVVNEYNQNGFVTVDTLQSLLSLSPQYIATLIDENGQLQLNTEAYEKLAQAEYNEMYQATVRQALNIAVQFQEEQEAIDFFRGSVDSAADSTSVLTQALIQEGAAMLQSKGWTEEATAAMEDYINTVGKIIGSVSKNFERSFPKPSGATRAYKAASTAAKSYYDQETEAFERMNRMGQKTTQQVVDFYRSMTKSGKISASERLKAEEKLFDAIKKQIQESLKLQIAALNKQKDAINSLADSQIESLNNRKESIEDSYDSQRESLESQKQAIEDAADAELKQLDRVQKAKDRAREREDYLRNRSEILEDLDSAKRRSGVDARRAEREAQKKLEELDREYQEKLEDYDIEDQREAIEANKEAQLKAIEEQMDALDRWHDSSIESIEDSIEAVEKQKEADLKAIDEKIDALNEKFSEQQINMLAYQAMTNEELYNQYVSQFIEPMANGMYDGFVQANDLMVDASVDYAQTMRSVYESELIQPITEELSMMGNIVNEYSSKISGIKKQLAEVESSKKPNMASKSEYFNSRNELSVTNNNAIYNQFDANKMMNKVLGNVTDMFYKKKR